MTSIKYITIEEFASFHRVTTELVFEFAEFGLIEINQLEKKPMIVIDKLEICERAIRLHRDLGVNKEGIEIILDMRKRHSEMQKELLQLRHQIKKHEEKMNQLFSARTIDVL